MAGRADLYFASIRSGQAAMMDALVNAEPDLIEATIDLTRRGQAADAAGMTGLHVAVSAGQTEAARRLIDHGAPLNARNSSGRMAIHDAFEYGRAEIVQLLIDAGCELDACAAAALGRNDVLKARLPDQANDLTTGLTPLGWAAYGQNVEGARLLVAAGAKVRGDPFDELAWGPACDVCATGVAQVMLDAGAEANWRDPDGGTALHNIVASPLVGDPAPFIEVLLAAGADPTLRNAAGHTALDLARAQHIAQAYKVQPGAPRKALERAIELLGGARIG